MELECDIALNPSDADLFRFCWNNLDGRVTAFDCDRELWLLVGDVAIGNGRGLITVEFEVANNI